ncbi:MAG: ABC transporter substrate-binding protein, partial [Actinobacteria bacterium]|nr:ABC transporter substrate-binding protein [Actinomycetota bacterium]
MACSLLAVVATACGGANEPVGESSRFILSQDYELPVVEREEPTLPARVTDASGTTVTVTDASRIVVLNQAIAEIVVSLGLRSNIIGRDATTTLESLQNIDEVSNGHDVSAESVLSLRPTVVIGDTRTGPPEALEQLRGAGVPVVIAPEVWTLSELPGRVTLLAVALGVPQAGERLIALSQAAIDEALKNIGKASAILRVAFLYVRGTASVYLLGG